MEVDCAGTSAAKQKRERRLRAAWKHEQLSVATALAAATHHSAPRGECRVPNEALQRQKTASAAGQRPAPHGRSRGCRRVAGKSSSSTGW